VVLGQLKSDLKVKVRVPLAVLVEYKGVVGMVVDQSFIEEDQEERSNGDQNHDSLRISNRYLFMNQELKKNYQKEIDIFTTEGYEVKDFSFVASSSQ